MNFWTGLILGIIVGWLVEWIIDWLFWRRDVVAEEEALITGQRAAELELECQDKLAAAELDYHERLAAVEAEWRERLNLNENQWQSQFAAMDVDREALRAPLDMASEADIVAEDLALDEAALSDFAVDEAFIDEGIMTADAADTSVSFADEMGAAVGAATMAEFDTTTGAPAPEAIEVVAEESAGTRDFLSADMPSLYSDEDSAGAPGDDLTRVRGIGPRYAALLADNGITTYEDLAAANPEHLEAILKPGPMQRINFASWSAQATALATTRRAPSGDDLTKLEGIGPMYAERLRNGGIATFAQLAEADENTLATIISAPAWRRINFASWVEQARLAAAGDTAGLQDLQSRLHRREGDNLSLIRGLGERSVAGLRAAGLDSFAALAAATPEQVEAAVRAGGGRGGDYAAWIEEAGHRAAGRRVARAPRRAKAAVVACPQDLSAVPGIGTTYEDRLYAAGIGSYWELAELSGDELLAILAAPPGRVDAGSIKAEAMRLAAETNSIGRGWSGAPPDNFEALGGIGEIYERRLYDAGICTFEALAATPPERLADICQAPALRLADYAGWIAHAAELAAARSS